MRSHCLWFSGAAQRGRVITEASAAGAEGAKPGLFSSSVQTANGLGDNAAQNSNSGAAITQGAPAQQPAPPPRSSVLGGEHCREVWGPPSQGCHSSPPVPTRARLSKAMEGYSKVCACTRKYRSVCRCSFMCLRLNLSLYVCVSMFVPKEVNVWMHMDQWINV